MEIPKALIDLIRKGETVLFLGAGATIGAIKPNGKESLLGNELRNLIVEEFLDPSYASESLSWVSELAISQTNLYKVQDFVAEQFRDLSPAEFHKLIPLFKWRGIVTTNYDRLVEKSYELVDDSIQNIVPFLRNEDRVDKKLRDPSSLALLKLHGCITRTHDDNLPLILTIDQYAKYREGRKRLFQMLYEWGSENTIIFIGHKLQDSNLREILLEITNGISSRPRYYLVCPGVDNIQQGFWAGKQISVLEGTFEEFIDTLSKEIPEDTRPLLAKLETDHPIEMHFAVKEKPSRMLIEFLSNDAEYVHDGTSIESGDPKKFYSGFNLGWYPIVNNLDVKRKLTNDLINEVILIPEKDRRSPVELFVIKAEAGAGKSVMMRRCAWDAATKAGVLCLRSRGVDPYSIEAISELIRVTKERVFLFFDNASENVSTIRNIVEYSRKRKLLLTIITAERINEWNMHCSDLDQYLTDEYRLRYLNLKEIESLIKLLKEHNTLGPNLERMNDEKRIAEFEKRAGRQLLVALHEATQGIPFEEIVFDEYSNIVPPEAQRLYLTVCVLNRLGVPVRAGLISRVHGIPFNDFKEKLFKPLEHVVKVINLPWRDYAYKARHSEIAEMVFQQALSEPADRYREYVGIIRELNTAYSVDYKSLRYLIKAKSINNIFPNYEDAKAVYEVVNEILGDDTYLLQQMANYERIRPNGNLELAQSLIAKAREMAPNNHSIIHTSALIIYARARLSTEILERRRYRMQARALLKEIGDDSPSAQYSIVTLLNIINSEIQDLLKGEYTNLSDIEEAIREADKVFEKAKQKYPENFHILSAESDFGKILNNDDRSLEALKKAFKLNTRDPYIASRLAVMLRDNGDFSAAKSCIEKALESNSGDKQINYQYANLLRIKGNMTSKDLAYYYRRAFTKWDDKYESQFYFARYSYESDDASELEKSGETFRHLNSIPMNHADRIAIRDAIGGINTPKRYSGSIKRMESAYGFINVDGRGDDIFFHETDLKGIVFDSLSSDVRVKFHIGFSYRGPKAYDIELDVDSR